MIKGRFKSTLLEGREVLQEAKRLILLSKGATWILGAVLALLPLLVKAYSIVIRHQWLLTAWEGRILASHGGGEPVLRINELLRITFNQSGVQGTLGTVVDVLRLLVLTPLLYTALALIYNGYVSISRRAPLEAVTMSFQRVRDLIILALLCSVAQWCAQMVPSLVSAVLSLLVGMFGWIPIVGAVMNFLAYALSLLISLVCDYALIVIFSYVWICAACERVTGFGAIVRSWQLTRNAMAETITALALLTVLRWLLVLVLAVIWLLIYPATGLRLAALIYAVHAVSALYVVSIGAVTSALYQRRPIDAGLRPDQFR